MLLRGHQDQFANRLCVGEDIWGDNAAAKIEVRPQVRHGQSWHSEV